MIKIKNGCVITHTPYNSAFVNAAKKMGGKWDKEENAWVFNEDIYEEVEDLLVDFYGYGEEKVTIELTYVSSYAVDNAWRENSISVFGRTLFKRESRDSEVKIYPGVSVIGEGFPGSGGSRGRPYVESPLLGTNIIIRDVPKSKISQYEELGEVKIREVKKPKPSAKEKTIRDFSTEELLNEVCRRNNG